MKLVEEGDRGNKSELRLPSAPSLPLHNCLHTITSKLTAFHLPRYCQFCAYFLDAFPSRDILYLKPRSFMLIRMTSTLFPNLLPLLRYILSFTPTCKICLLITLKHWSRQKKFTRLSVCRVIQENVTRRLVPVLLGYVPEDFLCQFQAFQALFDVKFLTNHFVSSSHKVYFFIFN